MKLPKYILLTAFTWLAMLAGNAQAAFVCPGTCAFGDIVLAAPDTDGVTAIVGTDLDDVLGIPSEDPNIGVRLADLSFATPDNDSVLTVHMSSAISNSLFIYSVTTNPNQRFRVEVSSTDVDGDFELIIPDPLLVDFDGTTNYFVNENTEIDISSFAGEINYVRISSLLPDEKCSAPTGFPFFGLDGDGCDKFNSAMLINAIAGTTATASVPVPAAVWLFGSGLLGLAGVARRRRK
jgi:hypothetical protein